MQVYFHHVTPEGAAADFPKTVFTDLPISLVEDNIPDSVPTRLVLLSSLAQSFPTGFFNCWGVPSGAASVIKNLGVGDAVLLVESNRTESPIPALCIVSTYTNTPLHDLSKILWGSTHYPFIFFFKTQELNLTWGEFISHVGYSPAYNPRGTFNPVQKNLDQFQGPAGYVKFLLRNYSSKPVIPYAISSGHLLKEVSDDNETYSSSVKDEIDNLVRQATTSQPKLTAGTNKVTKSSTAHPRDEAFRYDVRHIYGARCAICSISLLSPKGHFETQSAHIFPRSQDGDDDLRNGICLCRRHHWALDAGWLSLGDDLTIIVRNDVPNSHEYDFIRQYAGKKIAKPLREELSPHPIFLAAHRKLHGFEIYHPPNTACRRSAPLAVLAARSA